MFTVEQIKAAHSKVKSGADFPAYIQEIKSLGVTHYEAYSLTGIQNTTEVVTTRQQFRKSMNQLRLPTYHTLRNSEMDFWLTNKVKLTILHLSGCVQKQA